MTASHFPLASSQATPTPVLSPLDVFLIAEHARRAAHLIEHARRQAAVASDTMAFEALGLAVARLEKIVGIVDPQAAEGKGGLR